MESVETLIPDNEDNHLVVVLSFYEDRQKKDTFNIPSEFSNFEIVDIAIEKLRLDYPLGIGALLGMCQWLMEQFTKFPNAVFSFICSTDPLKINHSRISPEEYRWNLFEALYQRNIGKLKELGIESTSIVVGPDGYQTFARVFYRSSHAPIIHIVISHIHDKFFR